MQSKLKERQRQVEVDTNVITCPPIGASPLFEHPRTVLHVGENATRCPYCNTLYILRKNNEK